MKLKVVLNETEEIDLSRIDGLSSLSQSTSNNSEPQYGIVPNTGSIDLVDIDRKFQSMIDAGELPASSASADIYIDDKLVQKHTTTDSTYDKNGNELSISLSNAVDVLNNTVFSGVNYEGTPMSAYDILFRVFSEYYGESFTEEKFKELMSEKIVYGLNDELYGPIYSYLQKITLEFPYVETGKTYKEIIDEFCAMSQLQMYVDTDGYIKATSARPLIGEWDFVIANEHNQMSDIKEDLFVKNKYSGVEISENKFGIEKQFDTTVATIDKNINESDMVKKEATTSMAVDVKYVSGWWFNYVHTTCSYYVFNGSERFSKKTNNNLKEITKVNNSFELGENLSYSLTYKRGESNARAKLRVNAYEKDDGDFVVVLKDDVTNEKIQPVVFEEQLKSGKIEDDSFKYTVTFTGSSKELVSESKNNFPYLSEGIDVIDEGETFLVNYTVVCGKSQTSYYGHKRYSEHLFMGQHDEDYKTMDTVGTHIEEFATSLQININGDYYIISFNGEQIKNVPTSGVINTFTYPNSVFITDKTKYDGVKISSLITNKLLKDYSSGVKTASFKTTLSNLSTLHGYNFKVKDNYLIEIGDIVYPRRTEDGELYLYDESEGMYDNTSLNVYKTTGFNLLYDGEVINELELINVKYNPPMFSFEYDQATDGYIVTSNSNYASSTQLTIPETYDDGVHGLKNVSVVGVNAFNNFENLESIILPSGIKKISSRAFRNCSSLPFILLPAGLETISDEAFQNCSSLERMDIPDTVTTIYAYAFVGVPSNMVIYCNVTEKPENFHPYWNAYNYSGNTLQTNFIQALTFELVNGYYQVTGLADETVKHITIPDRYNGIYVVSIADNTFKGNTTIRTLDTGNMLARIGAGAFDSCYSLYKVTLGYGVETIGDGAFINCEKLVNVINKSSLNLLTGSTSNGYVKYYALDNITLRDIDGFVFAEKTVSPYNMSLISYDGKQPNITLPTQGTYEGENIYYNIYKYAFYGAPVETIQIGTNVVSIEQFAFAGCSTLTSVAIPTSISVLNSAVFMDCSSLKKVYIPSSVTTITATQFYMSPFRGCPSTTKIYCGAKSKPSGWGSYWNYYNASSSLSVSYGYTKEQFDAQ